ncbi:post-GPI attachment to proteins factor 6 isoform X2 [Orussus abietinus]|uniref:post-GPI attachment to proteins factor 6 isoform X2 n=1 Tax=Orussus abietinus TaxID=222816 RepID=UPI0006266D1D|nr:post-GPI attachment to proteins factor 6 isoform X2 [Orussus abietinus]
MRLKCSIIGKHVVRFLWTCYIYLLLFSRGCDSIIPEASQEGPLHPFKSYSDVATFHYTVPKEVLRATWQFAAFMDDGNCLPREVHIYLQRGSYPIISVNNGSFPPHMYPNRSGTIVISALTSFDSKTTTIVPVDGPEPGDWFVGAYLSHWDEKVQQQGLGHKCHYSIGSVALWTQLSGIQNIPIGYQETLRTTDTTSYYKIYIPTGTWNFRVQIWACNFTLHAFRDISVPCIQSMALKGHALPVFNRTHPAQIGNLSTTDSYTFIVNSPYEDSYYYLLIVSETIIEFNVEVSVTECPIDVLEDSFMRQYLIASSVSKSIQFHMNILKNQQIRQFLISESNFPLNKSKLVTSQDRTQNEQGNNDDDDECIPRFQLARIRHSKTFSGVYLMQGNDWLTPWIILTDTTPVIAQFDVLPLVDIGGTLNISIHLEMDRVLSKQLVQLNICIRQARVPDRMNGRIVCHDRNMSMNLSSFDNHDGTLLIPYPQPNTWHIALEAKCYMNGNIVKCEMQEILVLLDIKMRQCVFSGENACGPHGICQDIHKGLLSYTTCNCIGGYRGWGCTDATNVKSQDSLLLTTLMLTLSNGFFSPAIYIAVRRGFYTEGLVYLSTMLSSALYHACDQQFMTYCIAKYEILQYSDFFSSILAFWVTLIAMAELPPKFVSLCHMLGVLIIAFGVESNRTGLCSIMVPLSMGIMIPMAVYMYRCYKIRRWRWPRGAGKLLMGLSLALSGLLLYSLVETEENYFYVHSAWHMIIALSLVFLLPPAGLEKSLLLSSNSLSCSDSELLDYQNSPSIPVFTSNAKNTLLQ